MEIRYNVTGVKRKELVKVIADATGARAEYKFMPELSVRLGEFKTMFTFENPMSPCNTELINVYSQATNYLTGYDSSDETLSTSISKTPPLSLSAFRSAFTFSISADVRAVGGARNSGPPSYGV